MSVALAIFYKNEINYFINCLIFCFNYEEDFTIRSYGSLDRLCGTAGSLESSLDTLRGDTVRKTTGITDKDHMILHRIIVLQVDVTAAQLRLRDMLLSRVVCGGAGRVFCMRLRASTSHHK